MRISLLALALLSAPSLHAVTLEETDGLAAPLVASARAARERADSFRTAARFLATRKRYAGEIDAEPACSQYAPNGYHEISLILTPDCRTQVAVEARRTVSADYPDGAAVRRERAYRAGVRSGGVFETRDVTRIHRSARLPDSDGAAAFVPGKALALKVFGAASLQDVTARARAYKYPRWDSRMPSSSPAVGIRCFDVASLADCSLEIERTETSTVESPSGFLRVAKTVVDTFYLDDQSELSAYYVSTTETRTVTRPPFPAEQAEFEAMTKGLSARSFAEQERRLGGRR